MVITRQYVFDEVSFKYPLSFVLVLAFVWPLAILVHAWKRPRTRLTNALWFAEPLLLAGSLFGIQSFIIFNDPDIGTYVGWGGNCHLLPRLDQSGV
jgi:hypothetical protein